MPFKQSYEVTRALPVDAVSDPPQRLAAVRDSVSVLWRQLEAIDDLPWICLASGHSWFDSVEHPGASLQDLGPAVGCDRPLGYWETLARLPGRGVADQRWGLEMQLESPMPIGGGSKRSPRFAPKRKPFSRCCSPEGEERTYDRARGSLLH